MPWESKIRGLDNGMVEQNSPQSGPLAEAPEGRLTQAARLSPEQSIAGTEASRDAPEGGRGRSVRPALGEQNSRFAQRNG